MQPRQPSTPWKCVLAADQQFDASLPDNHSSLFVIDVDGNSPYLDKHGNFEHFRVHSACLAIFTSCLAVVCASTNYCVLVTGVSTLLKFRPDKRATVRRIVEVIVRGSARSVVLLVSNEYDKELFDRFNQRVVCVCCV